MTFHQDDVQVRRFGPDRFDAVISRFGVMFFEDPVAAFYREIFAPGTEGLVEFWRDASLGAVDIRGTRVFDWVTVKVPRILVW